jgi:hypothetical protein
MQHVLEIAAPGAEHAMQVAHDLRPIEPVKLAQRLALADLATLKQLRRLGRRRGDDVQLAGVHTSIGRGWHTKRSKPKHQESSALD